MKIIPEKVIQVEKRSFSTILDKVPTPFNPKKQADIREFGHSKRRKVEILTNSLIKSPQNVPAVGINLKKKNVKIKQEFEAEKAPSLVKTTRKKEFRPLRQKYAQIQKMSQNLGGEPIISEKQKETTKIEENKETLKGKKEKKT